MYFLPTILPAQGDIVGREYIKNSKNYVNPEINALLGLPRL
jgi:hypothetical protein